MKLPHASRARVEVAKVQGYLLSSSHSIGRMKARFFSSLGFGQDDPAALGKALESLAVEGDVVDQVSSVYGAKYVLDGVLRGPEAVASVRSVWIVEAEGAVPRLVTAYPAPVEGGPR